MQGKPYTLPDPQPRVSWWDPTALARAIRAHGLQRSLPSAIETELTRLPAGTRAGPGLYVERCRRPPLVVEGSVRVNLLRVVSLGESQERVVGTIQLVGHQDAPPHAWEMVLLLHTPGLRRSVELDDEMLWFTSILELHYRATGALVEFGVPVQA